MERIDKVSWAFKKYYGLNLKFAKLNELPLEHL